MADDEPQPEVPMVPAETRKVADRSRILVETDAPFLTPTPFRGRPNSPYLIPVTIRDMADRLGIDADELAAETAENTLRAYGSWD